MNGKTHYLIHAHLKMMDVIGKLSKENNQWELLLNPICPSELVTTGE